MNSPAAGFDTLPSTRLREGSGTPPDHNRYDTMRTTAIALGVSLFLTGCQKEASTPDTGLPTPSTAQCAKDTDCKGDRICEQGVCTAPAATAVLDTPAETPKPAPAAVPFDIQGDTIELKNGNELKIFGDWGERELRYGPEIVVEDATSLSFKKGFNVGDKQVILLETSSGGRACPATYFFIEFTPIGSSKMTDEFGTCSDIPVLKTDGAAIIVTMPSNDGDKSYRYANGTVTEL